MTQQRPSIYEIITLYREGRTTHYFGNAWNGQRVPLTEQQAHEARRDGVEIELPETALLAQRDGE